MWSVQSDQIVKPSLNAIFSWNDNSLAVHIWHIYTVYYGTKQIFI